MLSLHVLPATDRGDIRPSNDSEDSELRRFDYLFGGC